MVVRATERRGNVPDLPTVLPALVQRRLTRLGNVPAVVAAETAAMRVVRVAKTRDRAEVGILMDYAFAIPYHLARGAWDESTLHFVEARLAQTLCYSSRRFAEVVFPDRDTPARLTARWLVG